MYRSDFNVPKAGPGVPAYDVVHAWINDQHSSTNNESLYKKVQVLLVEYAILRDRD